MNQTTLDEIKAVLRQFQDGYLQRDPASLDQFMELFAANGLEVVGTGGIDPGDDEWCLDPASVRTLIQNDWKGWGDLRLELERARIFSRGDAAWCAVPATVTMRFDREEAFQDHLDYLKEIVKDESLGSAEQRLLEILRGGVNTLYELGQGETFVWPLRFTAVLVRDGGSWRFQQMQFSFATTRFPDVRITAG